MMGIFFVIGAACRPSGSIRRLSFKNPSSTDEGLLVFTDCPTDIYFMSFSLRFRGVKKTHQHNEVFFVLRFILT
jgi:hypothetical protein